MGGREIIKGNLQFGELIAFQQYTAMFIGPCMGVLKINESIQRLYVSLDRIYGFLETPSTIIQDNATIIINLLKKGVHDCEIVSEVYKGI